MYTYAFESWMFYLNAANPYKFSNFLNICQQKKIKIDDKL